MKLTTKQTGKELLAAKSILKVLLLCGILSSLLYVATDVLASWRYESYSYTDQTSKLRLIRPLVYIIKVSTAESAKF